MKSHSSIVALAACICSVARAHASQTVNYTYDALGRLTQSQVQSGPQTNTTVGYQYDAAGNRQQSQVSGVTSDTPVTLSMANTTVNVNSSGATIIVQVSASAATGTVDLTENGVYIGSAWVTNGQASIVLPGYPKGVHTLTATYSGDGADAAQTTTFTVKVQNLRWLPAVLQLLLGD